MLGWRLNGEGSAEFGSSLIVSAPSVKHTLVALSCYEPNIPDLRVAFTPFALEIQGEFLDLVLGGRDREKLTKLLFSQIPTYDIQNFIYPLAI